MTRTPGTETTIALWDEPNNVTAAWKSYEFNAPQYGAAHPATVTMFATHRGPVYDKVSLGGTGFFDVEDAERYASAILTVCKLARDHKSQEETRAD